MILKLILKCTLLLASSLAINATAMDCRKAALPFEKAVCADDALLREDEALNANYRFLTANCQLPNLATDQRKWLRQANASFSADASVALLAKRYADRNLHLNALMARCAQEYKIDLPLSLKTLQDKNFEYTLPFIQTTPSEVGARINDFVFERIFDIKAPKNLGDELTALTEKFADGTRNTIEHVSYIVLRNDGRLLVLELQYDGCDKQCFNNNEQFFFDARSGRSIEPEDLFTNAGAEVVAAQIKSNKIFRAENIRKRLSKSRTTDPEELEHYEGCIRDWKQRDASLGTLRLAGNSNVRFDNGGCSFGYRRSWDQLDELNETITFSDLRRYLNAYGRSLLLHEADAKESAPVLLQRCQRNEPLTEAVDSTTGSTVQAGVQVAQKGDGFVLKKDGSLWTEDYTASQPSAPKMIGNGFVRLPDPRATLATKADGSLWAWGKYRQASLSFDAADVSDPEGLAEVGRDFVKVSAAYPYFIVGVKKDGGLWATQQRGRVTRLDPVGCGYIDAIAFSDSRNWKHENELVVLAIRQDGALVAWGKWGYGDKWRAERQMFSKEPVVLGSGFARLYKTAGSEQRTLALQTDGIVLEWKDLAGASYPRPQNRLSKVEFSKDLLK